jgi:hypothetical protein
MGSDRALSKSVDEIVVVGVASTAADFATLLSSRLVGDAEANPSMPSVGKALLVYQAPWIFLAHGIARTESLQNMPEELEAFSSRILKFWHQYHVSLLSLCRENAGRSLLISGDHPIEVSKLIAMIAKRLQLEVAPTRRGLSLKANLSREESAAWYSIVEAVAPESLVAYTELESCAELMGRKPDFEVRSVASRRSQILDLLSILKAKKDLADAEAARGREIQALNAQLALWEADANRHREEADRLAHELADLQTLRKENELYLAQLDQLQTDAEQQLDAQRRKDQHIADLENRLRNLGELNQQKEGRLALLQQRLNHKGLLRQLARRMASIATGGAGRVTRAQRERILKSGLFDRAWYLATYPDVAKGGHDPFEHYLRYGVREGRNPSAHFQTKWYLETYRDVAAAEMNPLLHYVEFGMAEGRMPLRRAR